VDFSVASNTSQLSSSSDCVGETDGAGVVGVGVVGVIVGVAEGAGVGETVGSDVEGEPVGLLVGVYVGEDVVSTQMGVLPSAAEPDDGL
jgi:hypothetical protein